MTVDNATKSPCVEKPKVAIAKVATGLLTGGDSFCAIEFIASHDAGLAMEVCATLQHQLYWQKKDVRLSTAIARAGLQIGLMASAKAPDPTSAESLRAYAKGLAYDIGSFNWPGWDEPGVEIGPGDVAAGFDGARVNLRLAIELKKDDLPMARAHWLLGAYQLATHDTVGAAASFRAGAEAAGRAGAERDQLLNVGYTLIAALLEAPNDARLRADYESLKIEIARQQHGGEDVTQLATALRVFSRA